MKMPGSFSNTGATITLKKFVAFCVMILSVVSICRGMGLIGVPAFSLSLLPLMSDR